MRTTASIYSRASSSINQPFRTVTCSLKFAACFPYKGISVAKTGYIVPNRNYPSLHLNACPVYHLQHSDPSRAINQSLAPEKNVIKTEKLLS